MKKMKKPYAEKLEPIDTLIQRTTDSMKLGFQCLEAVSNKQDEIHFFQWARLVREDWGNAKEMSLSQLQWLWDAITSEPNVDNSLGNRIVSLEEEWKEIDPVTCAPAGSRFGIFLKGFRRRDVPGQFLPYNAIPQAYAKILDPLIMKPGKGRRLECTDVPTNLELELEDIGTIEIEANALKLSPREIEITENTLVAYVKSLNHAYTKASLRLETERRGHGGRAYDHIALKQENGGWKTLEDLRLENERRLWKKLLGEDEIEPEQNNEVISP